MVKSYVEAGKAAVVVPVAITLSRDRLKTRGISLPPNIKLYDILRDARFVDADETGRSVRRIKVQGRQGPVLLSALISPAEKVVPKPILPALLPSHFEILTESAPEAATEVEGKARGERK